MEQAGVFARVNDSIRKIAAANDLGSQFWEFMCECPDVECHAFVTLTVAEFDERRAASPPMPVLATKHKPESVTRRY
jgi:hypothetical protein